MAYASVPSFSQLGLKKRVGFQRDAYFESWVQK